MLDFSDISENTAIDDLPDDKEIAFDEHFPRYIPEPFEIINYGDPRYDTALTREELYEMNNEPAQR